MTPDGALWPPVVAIVGPTAVGKTRLSLALAAEFGAAVISVDSRQVYRYLDIGTDKPSIAERGEIPHYLLDVVQPSELYSASSFQTEGTRVLRRLAHEGRAAFLVGGTGFYLRGLLDRDEFPPVPPNTDLRQELNWAAQTLGAGAVYDRLERLDPRSARRIHPNNLARLIRAVEIVETTGKPIEPVRRAVGIPALYLGLHRGRAALIEAADRRVDLQMASGLVEETRTVLAMGYTDDAPGLQGLGYREVIAYLKGELSQQQATERYKAATRAYIRRQMTWFRADDRIRWLESGSDALAEARIHIAAWLATGTLVPVSVEN